MGRPVFVSRVLDIALWWTRARSRVAPHPDPLYGPAMATLVTLHPDGSETRTPVYKSLTTIGSDPESDVALAVAEMPAVAAHIAYDGRVFSIATTDRRAEILVSGKRVRKQVLVDGDELVIGSVHMRFLLEEKSAAPPKPSTDGSALQLEAYRRLLAFSPVL
ncbi:MAG: FHA domain-containing protein, partial [Myxococcota bacterium]